MTKRPDEKKAPAPIGGAAAERLRMFEEARGGRQKLLDDTQQIDASNKQQKKNQHARRETQ